MDKDDTKYRASRDQFTTDATPDREPKPKRKGMIMSIYRDANGSDCTLGGISAKHKDVLLVGDGVPEIFDETPDCPAVKIGSAGGRIHLRPVDDAGVWFMFGGNFAYSCDSRLRPILGDGPVHIHDRRED